MQDLNTISLMLLVGVIIIACILGFMMGRRSSAVKIKSIEPSEVPHELSVCKDLLSFLIVENDLIGAMLLRKYLEGPSHEVVEVNTGEQILDQMTKRKFDVVFVSCDLLGVNVFEFTADFKKKYNLSPLIKKTKFVCMVSSVRQFDWRRAQKSGYSEIIQKPVQWRDVQKILDQFCLGNNSSS